MISSLLLFLLLVSAAPKTLANEVRVRSTCWLSSLKSLKKVKLVSGEVSLNKSRSGVKQLQQQLQGIKHVAAGTKAVFECVGQWQQDTDITASFFKGKKSREGCKKSFLVFLSFASLSLSQMDCISLILTRWGGNSSSSPLKWRTKVQALR